MTLDIRDIAPSQPAVKFTDPDRTAKGEPRAKVALTRLDTLWLNTGTLCNITCRNCYIESSPSNDRLAYLTAAEARAFLHEAKALGTREIGFTGGEPFLNPDILEMLSDALGLGFDVLVLTNAMLPMQRPAIKSGLTDLLSRHGANLTIRVSLDHYSDVLHDEERGAGSFEKTIAGIDWLAANGFRLAIAGRSCWHEEQAAALAGYGTLFQQHGWPLDAANSQHLMIFPEMDIAVDVPEITPACWGILGKNPDAMMCASSRMVVKRRGAERPTVVPCTLLPYDTAFEMGTTLDEAARAHGRMFDKGAVKLCHPHCSKFCVLGGGSCS